MSTRLAWMVVGVGGFIASTTPLAGRQAAQPVPSNALCWQPLALDTGPQDVGLAFAPPTLAVGATGDIWLGWQDDWPHLRRWLRGQWASVPLPEREGFEGMWEPMVATAPSGQVFLVASANGDDGITALHVARARGESWEWLGAPLISTRQPFRHAHRASIAFVDGDRPVVAWSEEQDARLAGLFVARWDGRSWTRLGALDPEAEDTFLSPAVAVDARQDVWLAWNDLDGAARVVRWSGSAWTDVGRDELQQLTTAPGPAAGREISLKIDGQGRAWVLRSVYTGTPGARLALARWDGSRWADVAAPRGPEGKESTVWSAAMILRSDAPVIAWSQADASDNHYLFVSEWTADGRWMPRLSGLHLVEGVSNVRDVTLAAGDANSVIVAWDEPGKDQRRTRLVRAYTCAAGEQPAAPPTSVVERDTWPTTVDEAARRIVGTLSDESKARVRATSRDQLIQYHSGWGMGIRNSFGLWRGNDKLLESCGKGTRVHPDDCSMVIIEAVWALLREPA